MADRIDVEVEFTQAVKAMGGTVVSDLLSQPAVDNADFWFAEFGVIAELKCMSEDWAAQSLFNDQVRTLALEWQRQGLVKAASDGHLHLSLPNLPEQCAAAIMELARRRLKTVIHKASNQIKSTKVLLEVPEAKGVLLLVNDGNALFNPRMMATLVTRLFGAGQYSAIDSILFFSVNESIDVPNVTPIAPMIWIEAIIPPRVPAPQAFFDRLRDTWLNHEARMRGETIAAFDYSSQPRLLDDAHLSKLPEMPSGAPGVSWGRRKRS